MSQYQQRPQRHSRPQPQPLSDALLGKINLESPDAELFDATAQQIAKEVSEVRGETNRSTQLRRFYDEVVTWHVKVQQNPEEFARYLPMIRMLNAKVAYAEGRKLVDVQFSSLIRDCLRKVKCEKTFNNFKLFFEAFLGFYKMYKPR